MSLGENIYKGRVAQNWSQTDLADALAVSRQSVSKWENGTATPDLDKLIKMKELFGITLDELVFGEATPPPPTSEDDNNAPTKQSFEYGAPNIRVIVGIAMMIFGMFFLLLSMFWGDLLAFGETVGELVSALLVLISMVLLAPYNFKVFSICTVIYFIYAVVSFGIMKVANSADALFTFVASIVILVWFIACGMHATKGHTFKNDFSGEKSE